MATLIEIEKLAFELPEKQRAMLASSLLGSLPRLLEDDDDGLAEALRRQKELEENPEMGISFDELKEMLRNR